MQNVSFCGYISAYRGEGPDERLDIGNPDLEEGGVLDDEAAACPQARLAVAQVVVGDGGSFSNAY